MTAEINEEKIIKKVKLKKGDSTGNRRQVNQGQEGKGRKAKMQLRSGKWKQV